MDTKTEPQLQGDKQEAALSEDTISKFIEVLFLIYLREERAAAIKQQQ